ncbi:hypothetical protein [Chryseobacterium wanjuense]
MENSEVLETHLLVGKCSENLSSVEDAIYVIGGKWKLKNYYCFTGNWKYSF